MLSKDEKKSIFEKYGKNLNDVGNTKVQVALFTEKIIQLTEHLKVNKKDYTSRRRLFIAVGKRKGLLNYLKRKDIHSYLEIKKELGIRK